MLSLGVDVGSTNVKVVLVELDGSDRSSTSDSGTAVRERAVAATPTPVTGQALVRDVLRLVEQVASATDRPPECVGVASMAETGVPIDGDDQPIGELVRWDGHRGQADADALVAVLGAAELFGATGVRPSGKAPLAAWAHLRRTDPGRWGSMRRWAGAADLVVLALTGQLVTDHTLAGRTMAYRLPEPGQEPPHRFDADLLATVGLQPDRLPAVVAPGADAATTRSHAGGLRPGTPVVVAGHDHQVGSWAAGVRAPGEVGDSIGTAEAVITVLDRRPDAEAVRAAGMSLVRTVGGVQDALVAGSSSAGSMLPWWRAHVLGDTDRGPAAVDALLRTAADRRRPAGCFVLPYLHGRQAPSPDACARARLIGPDGSDEVDLAGALLDGLSLQARWMLVAQAALSGRRGSHPVRVLGSAARDGSPWLRTKAAVGPDPLRVVLVAEPVATGAALLAAQRCGLAGEALRLPDRLVLDEPVAGYDAVYPAFVEAAQERTAA